MTEPDQIEQDINRSRHALNDTIEQLGGKLSPGQIVDEAIQVHGATGVSQWTPLARIYAAQRTLRLADGPDEVHWHVVGRAEISSHSEAAKRYDPKNVFRSEQSLGSLR